MKLIDDFSIEVHFNKSDMQMKSIKRVVKETGKPVYAIEDEGAIVVNNSKIEVVGNVHFFKE